MKAKLRDEEAASFSAASAPNGMKGAAAAGPGGKTKRKGLGFYEQAEYKKIQKIVETLTTQKDVLQDRVMALSSGGKSQVGFGYACVLSRSYRLAAAKVL